MGRQLFMPLYLPGHPSLVTEVQVMSKKNPIVKAAADTGSSTTKAHFPSRTASSPRGRERQPNALPREEAEEVAMEVQEGGNE